MGRAPYPSARGWLAGLVVAVGVASVGSLALGSVLLPPRAVLAALVGQAQDPLHHLLVYELRLPRVLGALAVGAALGVAGLLLQTLLQNPLAGPGVLGISAGASLGVAFVVFAGGSSMAVAGGLWQSGARVGAAFVGAGVATAGVVLLAARVRDSVVLLIAGLMLGHLLGGLVGLWQYYSAPEKLKEYLVWSLGSLGGLQRTELPYLYLPIGVGLLGALALASPLNALVLGEAYGQTLGVPLRRVRIAVVALTSLLTAAVTAFAGPIGFVGIAVPHLARALYPHPDHYRLIPLCACLGALVVVVCDAIAQAPGYATVLPLSIVTALVGAPVVVWVLLRKPLPPPAA